MEKWEEVIQNYDENSDEAAFGKALQTANEVFKEDLADFEIDRILDTLLFSPVDLLPTVARKYGEDSWCKAIIEALKLIVIIVDKCPKEIPAYCENIVKVCLLPHKPNIQQHALVCLERVARVSPDGATNAVQHVTELEMGIACKTPLALLVGTLCELYPEVMADEVTRIWKIYLKMLECNKNTDTLISAILQGLCGVFKNFGRDLPVAELGEFYNTIHARIRTSKCEDVCLKVLENYADLFKERIFRDNVIRGVVWDVAGRRRDVYGALRGVYTAVAGVTDSANMKNIIEAEILPQAFSVWHNKKITTLKLLSYLRDRGFDTGDLSKFANTQTLEFDVRCGQISYDLADMITWYIDARLPECDKLLQTSLLFIENIPSVKRKDVIRGVLTSAPDVRAETVVYLATISCMPSDGGTNSIDKYIGIWRGLFEEDAGSVPDMTAAFENFITHVIFNLDLFLDEDVEELPEKLSSLLSLSAQVCPLLPSECPTEPYSALLSALVRCAAKCCSASLLHASAAAYERCQDVNLRDITAKVQVDRCHDETMLCASCLYLLHVDAYIDPMDKLKALQIIFSRNDVDVKTLLLAVDKLEHVLGMCERDCNMVDQVIHLVGKLQSRSDLIGKDARVLRRRVDMFLGEYRTSIYASFLPKEIESILGQLQDGLCLTIQNYQEAVEYKVNLREILHLAIIYEDADSLYQLLKILCVDLSRSNSLPLQRALCVVVYALAICHARGAAVHVGGVQRAMYHCTSGDSVRTLLHFISVERSPGARKMLSDGLECLLQSGSDEMINTVAERAIAMLDSADSTTRRAGLDITEILISSIKDNHKSLKEILPDVLEIIPKYTEIETISTFDCTSNIFIDKIEIFDMKQDFVMNILKNLIMNNRKDFDLNIYKRLTRNVVAFLKRIIDSGKISEEKLIELLIDYHKIESNRNKIDSNKYFYVLSCFKRELSLLIHFWSPIICDTFKFDDIYKIDFDEGNGYVRLDAILVFLKEFADVLLELDYKRTTEFIAELIKSLKSEQVIQQEKSLTQCMASYKDILKRLPHTITLGVAIWCDKLRLNDITVGLEKDCIHPSQYIEVNALKIILSATDYKLTDISRWPSLVLKRFIDGAGINLIPYLTDCLLVSVRCMSVNEIKKLISDGQATLDAEPISVKFLAKFMKAFVGCFLMKPYILMDESLAPSIVILNDVVRYCVRKKCAELCDQVVMLIDEIWPIYEKRASFRQKIDILEDMSRLPKQLGVDSNPLQWVAGQLASSDTTVEKKTRLVVVLPAGDEFSECYENFAQSCLGASLSECGRSASEAFRSAACAVAERADRTLLRIVATLANTDEGVDGWWNTALESCAQSLARTERMDVYGVVYTLVWDDVTFGACERIMVPLLRYSTPAFCEKFFSAKIKELLKILRTKQRVPSAHFKYHKTIVDHTRALVMLQIAVEKIPLSSLQSPQSLLYSTVESPTTNYLTDSLRKLCVKLRTDSCPAEADSGLKRSFMRYQCALYNCLYSVLTKCDVSEHYRHLHGEAVWSRIVDETATYKLPIVKRRRTNLVAVASSEQTHGVPTSSSASTTCRTRLFLRTLSDDPLKYDLLSVEDRREEVKIEEIEIIESELNGHQCAGTLTAMFRRFVTKEYIAWIDDVAAALDTTAGYLLAQIICNCKEELKPHANKLRDALFKFIVNTAREERDVKLLNGLHIDIIEVLTHWRQDIAIDSIENVNITLTYLIHTIINTKQKWLLELLDKFLDVYHEYINISFDVIKPYIEDKNNDVPSITISILQKITKHKVYIEMLAQTLVQYDIEFWRKHTKIAEVFGATLANMPSNRHAVVDEYRKLLDRARRNIDLYVKMLCYAQKGCGDVCDLANFRFVTDQTPKLPKTLKNKCLQIISNYISDLNASDDYVKTMFDCIELNELLTQSDCENAMILVKNGLHLMEEGLKRRVVMQIGEYCHHPSVKMRRVAYSVMVKAFEDILKPNKSNSAKKMKADHTPLLSILSSVDTYKQTVTRCVSMALVDDDIEVVHVIVDMLANESMAIRLAECMLLCTYSPNVCASVPSSLLKMLFNEKQFHTLKLSNKPLEKIDRIGGQSRMVSSSRTYQSSMLSKRSSSARLYIAESPCSDLDVEIPVISILDTFLQFAKKNPEASRCLATQVYRCVRDRSSGFDPDAAIARRVAAMLNRSRLTPLAVEMARLVVDAAASIDGVLAAVENLLRSTADTEGGPLVQSLLEEVEMRCYGPELYVLGSTNFITDQDVTMDTEIKFSLKELLSCFGKLSNWDDMTLQRRSSVQAELPTVWANSEVFKLALDNYEVDHQPKSWFDKLVLSYRGMCKRDSALWLSESQRWPRRLFDVSAVTEAVSWQTEMWDPWPCEITAKDCLLEWAARLMIRVAHTSHISEDDDCIDYSRSRSHELSWCVRANEMGLHAPVLQCCERNSSVDSFSNDDEEKLLWATEKLRALRGIGLERNDRPLLENTLVTLDEALSDHDTLTPEIISGYKLKVMLHQDLGNLSDREILSALDKAYYIKGSLSTKNKRTMLSIYEMGLLYYSEQLDQSNITREEFLVKSGDILKRMSEQNLGPDDVHLAVVLKRLDGNCVDSQRDTPAQHILNVIKQRYDTLDDFTREQVGKIFNFANTAHSEDMNRCKKYLSLIRDAKHSLYMYCEMLAAAARDGNSRKWRETFDRIKDMMDNEYAGTDYRLLENYKRRLYDIMEYDDTNVEDKMTVLKDIVKDMGGSERNTLRLSQLCPALTNLSEIERDDIMPRLLSLGRHKVIKFDEEVVVCYGIRRACAWRVVTSCGVRVRRLAKAGEPLRAAAAAARVATAADIHPRTYHVTPVSEDSGVIEYLEDHQNLSALISSSCPKRETLTRKDDLDPILKPTLEEFHRLAKEVPAYCLRSAIERNSSCALDFVAKKGVFQDTLATASVLCWMLGLGDRHLDNLMCSTVDGGLCAIDWGALLQFGLGEVPPARLTRNLVGVCHREVLESRLQSAVKALREQRRMLVDFIWMSFKWMGREFEDKYHYIEGLLSGQMVSYQVTRKVIEASDGKYKREHLDLLDKVFEGWPVKQMYSVEEQVSSLLLQSTDLRILNATRNGWEPWI